MTENMEGLELRDRLNLIENMIAEGRRRTEKWGWTFLLWGVAYYVAIAWSTLGHSNLAWPVTMVAAAVLTAVFASRNSSKGPETTIGRAMMAIWAGMGISTFIVMLSVGISGRMDLHIAVAFIGAMLGAANFTSSIILKWKMQFACALMWLTAGAASCFLTENQAGILFLVAIFFCQIVFGIYGMIADSRKQKVNGAGQGVSHA
ncbi:MAG: hypothetical protein ABR976_04910 [Terracidiphilus sp.]|jgi:fatty acid desaturase